MKGKRIAYTLAAGIILFSFSDVGNVYAMSTTVKESEQKIDKLETKKEKVKKEIENKEKEIDQLMLEIDFFEYEKDLIELEISKNEEKLRKIRKQIVQTQKEVDELQDSIDKRKEIVGERMKAYQLNGNIDYLDILFGSEGIIDFFTRMFAVNTILDADSKIIEDFARDLEIVENKLREIEDMELEVKQLKKSNEEKKVDLENNIKLTNKAKKKLSSEIKKLNLDTKEIEKEQDELMKKINQELGMKIGLGKGQLEWPTIDATYISSNIGTRTHPKTGKKGSFHSGIDIARNDKSNVPPIYAAEAGTIIEARVAGGYGNMIKIRHANGVETLYGHLSKINVKVGQEVRRGQTIGIMGTTGMSTGIHLHFEVFENGKLQNPLRYVK